MLEREGFVLVDDFLSTGQLAAVFDDLNGTDIPLARGGIRNIEKKYPSIARLVRSQHVLGKANQYLPDAPKFVRAILFDKTPENNWLVAWHQDRTVSVSDKFEDGSWGPWSVKDAVQHVQPPIEVLEQMVTIRIHLDASTTKNGCLRVLPRSHLNGILSQTEINNLTSHNHEVFNCEARAGSALIMRPHLLHSSSKASEPTKRRVLHLEFCSYALPNGIFWA